MFGSLLFDDWLHLVQRKDATRRNNPMVNGRCIDFASSVYMAQKCDCDDENHEITHAQILSSRYRQNAVDSGRN